MHSLSDDEHLSPAVRRELIELQNTDSGHLLGEIQKNCFLLYVTVRRWDGKYLIRNANIQIDGVEVDAKMASAARWKLIPDEWHKKIQPFIGQVRTAIYKVAVPFRDGVYIVPKDRAKGLVESIQAIRDLYRRQAQRFADQWPDILDDLRDKIQRKYGDAEWNLIQNRLPKENKLLSLFDIEIGLWPIGKSGASAIASGEDISYLASHVDDFQEAIRVLKRESLSQELEDFIEVVRRLVKRSRRKIKEEMVENVDAWFEEASATSNKMVAEAVAAMVQEPIQAFQEALANLERVQEDGHCKTGTIDIVRRAYSKLHGFRFLLPSEMADRLEAVELKLGGITPADLNNMNHAGAGLVQSLRDISEELVSDEITLRSFGQFQRTLDI